MDNQEKLHRLKEEIKELEKTYAQEVSLKLKALEEQISLQEEMWSHGLNLVQCCRCGTTFIHRSLDISCQDEEGVICWGCGNEVYTQDCEDFFKEGMTEWTDLANENDRLNKLMLN
jgi:hypothetical protein